MSQVLSAAVTDLQQVAALSDSVPPADQLRQCGFKARAVDSSEAQGESQSAPLLGRGKASSAGSAPDVELACDVVVVGSGAGGGVAAGILAGSGDALLLLLLLPHRFCCAASA